MGEIIPIEECRRVPLYSSTQAATPLTGGGLVDSDPAFGQQLFYVPIGEPVPEVPPDRHQDHLRREPEPAKLDRESGTRQ
jgi:hypothetical protein